MRIGDPESGVVPSDRRIQEDVERIVTALWNIFRKDGCIVHGKTCRSGWRWQAAREGAEHLTNKERGWGGARVKKFDLQFMVLHEDAWEVERQYFVSHNPNNIENLVPVVPEVAEVVEHETTTDVQGEAGTEQTDEVVILAQQESELN